MTFDPFEDFEERCISKLNKYNSPSKNCIQEQLKFYCNSITYTYVDNSIICQFVCHLH